ncbi:hypothetical protein TPHA_0B04580 [Tetrapisispora phaffii CBS 4417]|uniref:Post-GPI attachment to proteins factor 3 n=1 Tax=Tetrapisispora phaffii (strain ATCC 24235 / CBS 4417 / NBRC 1672 / NRRL Y-8282 / UCD 70-5) TaxID=1071381 RepID=G8BQ46_TETPH|nr:hypothetical protein TPHA_0B04580 [Tetrapisispora phaffii CBS 4417]CCE62127.1 hypothetical protein TPHA_0B04580 [Tetrapisispora phaffii CBS 4417]
MLKRSIICCLLLTAFASGSPGDNLEEFDQCLKACTNKNNCHGFDMDFVSDNNKFKMIVYDEVPPVLKKFFFWDCDSDCDYRCQQLITRLRISDGEEIFQFHGKWPFRRFLTMQEFFSTIFSIGNFFPHLFGFIKLRKAIRRYSSQNGMNSKNNVVVHLKNYSYVAISGMFAWTASTIFHWRDLPVTENLDYFFAGMTVLMGFHAIFARIARLDRKPQYLRGFFWLIVTIFGCHVLRLYLSWSYTYNMRFNIALGLTQYVLLLVLAFQNYQSLKVNRKKLDDRLYNSSKEGQVYRLCVVPSILVISTALAMSLELFDFFSYTFQIDAHAIWHLSTIWPSWIMYGFFIDDFKYITTKNNRE